MWALLPLWVGLVGAHAAPPACADGDGGDGVDGVDEGVEVQARMVSVHVKPWADVFVDGALVEKGARRVFLPLTVGEHIIVFRNPAALEEARRVVIPPASSQAAVPPLLVELTRRPAHVTVESNVLDADVEVCGPKTSVAASGERPIPVPLMDSPATIEVRVSRRGFSTVTRRVEVEAGKPVRVNVHLARE